MTWRTKRAQSSLANDWCPGRFLRVRVRVTSRVPEKVPGPGGPEVWPVRPAPASYGVRNPNLNPPTSSFIMLGKLLVPQFPPTLRPKRNIVILQTLPMLSVLGNFCPLCCATPCELVQAVFPARCRSTGRAPPAEAD